MNIKQAKEEIKNSIRAYLKKDEFGEYEIPIVSQRPILLIGPPGIGKTAIMEQAARECKIGFVSYTITHHTRQSAVGLPFIEKKQYGGKEYSVTEYTMSEIIASVYEEIEKTGLSEGILFIDEINCVSETLAPTMLKFLQCKMFGNHKVPEGFIITAAGNPPEYNKSVRELDIVTLDRVKQITITEDFSVWKEYGLKQMIHGSILSYLELKKEHFYHIETKVDGKYFVTARGWEDLSKLLVVYEKLGIEINEDVILQYIQDKKIAKDFSLYYELYQKYKNDYQINEIFDGKLPESHQNRIREAAFDEKISILGLLLSGLSERFLMVQNKKHTLDELYDTLKRFKEILLEEKNLQKENLQKKNLQKENLQKENLEKENLKKENLEKKDLEEESLLLPEKVLWQQIKEKEAILAQKKAEKSLERREEKNILRAITKLFEFQINLKKEHFIKPYEAFEYIKGLFEKEKTDYKAITADVLKSLEFVFDFIEQTFGESQEMVIFITELTINPISMWFIREYNCEKYYKYNKNLLFHERRSQLLDEIRQMNAFK